MARTRQRLQKYNVLQLRMLDMYALKKVKLNPMHIKLNKKLQKGHASEYEAILRAEGQTEQADKFSQEERMLAIETNDAMEEMRSYVNQNALNPSDQG